MQISGDLEVFPPQKCLVCGGNSSWPLLVGVFTSKNIRKNSGLGIISPEAPWRCVENGILEKKQKNIPSRELTNISKKKGEVRKIIDSILCLFGRDMCEVPGGCFWWSGKQFLNQTDRNCFFLNARYQKSIAHQTFFPHVDLKGNPPKMAIS